MSSGPGSTSAVAEQVSSYVLRPTFGFLQGGFPAFPEVSDVSGFKNTGDSLFIFQANSMMNQLIRIILRSHPSPQGRPGSERNVRSCRLHLLSPTLHFHLCTSMTEHWVHGHMLPVTTYVLVASPLVS